ncbi:ferric reductase-like transmembrane domain-containing protein [Roseobacter sp. EG26]|uniref:ferric reductase-like transmembrane domain-containing protein n=1 Tax=Roseobacter sp. EG26 TaxID=3412477 RepID=UPI0026353E75|nr:ferric reductase-like transmembrane domain-containing protein [uncultured Roseobacter sp.]
MRRILIWGLLAVVVGLPIAGAATSPLLAWRDPVYVASGFAGVVGMALLLIQPMLARGYLPGLPLHRSRRVHRVVGVLLIVSVLAHVAGLWITSPPDVLDALLFASPTPFSAWGVIAMWAVFAAALLAVLRRRLGLPWRSWRLGHTALASVTVLCSVVHALLIEGTMEMVTKWTLCVLVLVAMAKALVDGRGSRLRSPSR